jgi:hypothetical protein
MRALHDEIEAVTKTEADYLSLETDQKLKDAASIAFDELRRRYASLETRVSTELRANISPAPKLLRVADKTDDAKIFELKDDVTRAIETNESGYLLMASTGEYVPSVRIETLPEGATISYFRESVKDSPQTAPHESDTDINFLEYAFWTFRATKDGFTTTDVSYNAYTDTHHVVQIKLQEKKH